MTERRRRRPHAALAGRVLATGLAAGSSVGLIGILARADQAGATTAPDAPATAMGPNGAVGYVAGATLAQTVPPAIWWATDAAGATTTTTTVAPTAPIATAPVIPAPSPSGGAAPAPPVTAPPVTAPPVTAPPITAPPITAPPVTAPPVTQTGGS